MSRAPGHRHDVAQIKLHPSPSAGERTIGDASLVLIPGVTVTGGSASALYIPDTAPFANDPDRMEGLQLRLDSTRLVDAAARLSEFAWSPRRFEQLLQQPISVETGSTESDRYLNQLITLASLMDQWGGSHSTEDEQLGLEGVLDRLVVLCFWGDWILGVKSRRASGTREKTIIIDELLGWIRANCHRSISLAELEQRSGYSQRSLRNAFQERFGCAPNEWIRRTRMQSARQRLLDSQPGDTVSSIAEEHGYSHVSQFSRDFRGIFGLQPSQVMRRGRRPID